MTTKPINKHYILLVKNNNLLGAGIESLLREQEGLLVKSIAPDGDMALVREIRRFCPDIVILDQGYPAVTVCRLLYFLLECPSTRLLLVSYNNNLVQVYRRQLVWLNQAADLIAMLQTGNGG